MGTIGVGQMSNVKPFTFLVEVASLQPSRKGPLSEKVDEQIDNRHADNEDDFYYWEWLGHTWALL